MNLVTTISVLSGLFLIGGYIPYIYEVIKKTTIPNKASWLIWSLSTVSILFTLGETGTHEAIFVPIADALGCTIIFVLALFIGEKGWSKTDKFSFLVSIVSLLVWVYTGNPLIALIANLLVYTSGYIPTIAKSIKDPHTESFAAWTLFMIGVTLNLILVAIGSDTGFAVWLYPIVLMVTVGTLYVCLLRKFFIAKKI